jgi:hypothetical protein
MNSLSWLLLFPSAILHRLARRRAAGARRHARVDDRPLPAS